MSGEAVRLTVSLDAEGARLDTFLASALAGSTRSAIRRWILDGRVQVEGRPAPKPGLALKSGMHVEVHLPEAPAPLLPEEISVPVVHEDEHLIVVDKPAGLVVHPGHGRRCGTLVNALLGRGTPLAPAGGADRPGIVHRLDASTSGLLVVAKTDPVLRALQRAFAERRVRKVYHALVWGRPEPNEGRIDRSIGRSRSDPTRMDVRGIRTGRSALTFYRTLETLPGFTLLEVRIETGRTHQIRVHLQAIHHPVVGDPRYGGEQARGVQDPRRRKALLAFRRLALHASELSFAHPATGSALSFRSALPPELTGLLGTLRGTDA